MKKIWFLKFALAVLIWNWSSLGLGASQCHTVHRNHQESFSYIQSQFISQFEGRTRRNQDPIYFQATRILVHNTAVRFATDPDLKSHANEFKATLEQIIAKRQSAPDAWSDNYLRLLQDMIGFLDLSQGSLEGWKTYILRKHEKINFHNGTPAYLLRALPRESKISLLKWLGKEYSDSGKRYVTEPIHMILNAKSLYQQFKAQGRSDREFYNEYLARIKKYVFRSDPEIGGYSGDMVIEIAKIVQTYLKSRTDLKALNFFGSVPNGFGTPKSDLDIFNHIVDSDYPELANQEKEWMRAMGPSPLNSMRYQIDDPILADMIHKVTGPTIWTWHLENHGAFAEEHLAKYNHLFSFYITKDKIELRFYDNYILLDPTSTEDSAHYIVLKIE